MCTIIYYVLVTDFMGVRRVIGCTKDFSIAKRWREDNPGSIYDIRIFHEE